MIRELNFSVKGIGISNFKENEINFIKEMGNENAKKIWLAKLDQKDKEYPHTKEFQKHIIEKYIEKKFYIEEGIIYKQTNEDNIIAKSEIKQCDLIVNKDPTIKRTIISGELSNSKIVNFPKKFQSSNQIISYQYVGKSNTNFKELDLMSPSFSNNNPNSSKSSKRINFNNFSDTTESLEFKNPNNYQSKKKSFDFSLFNNSSKTDSIVNSSLKSINNTISKSDFTYDFTTQSKSSIINKSITYMQKKRKIPWINYFINAFYPIN